MVHKDKRKKLMDEMDIPWSSKDEVEDEMRCINCDLEDCDECPYSDEE
jgi:hypothetical protein